MITDLHEVHLAPRRMQGSNLRRTTPDLGLASRCRYLSANSPAQTLTWNLNRYRVSVW